MRDVFLLYILCTKQNKWLVGWLLLLMIFLLVQRVSTFILHQLFREEKARSEVSEFSGGTGEMDSGRLKGLAALQK